MMGSLGHNMGFAQFLKLRMRGRPAWFARRTYYLLQMPGWSRRLRMMIDWTFGLLFRPDIVKVGLDTETASLLRELGLGDADAASPKKAARAEVCDCYRGSMRYEKRVRRLWNHPSLPP